MHVLGDFAKAERAWVAALCEIMADNAGLLATRQGREFQNKVHLAMQAKGFGRQSRRPERKNKKEIRISWDSNAASSACRTSASRRSSMR